MTTSRIEQESWVARYRESSLSMRAFAAEHALVYHRLVYWVAQARRRAEQQGSSSINEPADNEFVALSPTMGADDERSVGADSPQHACVRIMHSGAEGSSVQVAFSSLVTPAYVVAVARGLGA